MSVQKAIHFSRDLYKSKNVYRSPIIYLGESAYEEYLDFRDLHVWSLKLCAYVPDPKALYDTELNLEGMAVHVNSIGPPNEELAKYLVDCGAEAVFCTHLGTQQTVFFGEVRNAA